MLFKRWQSLLLVFLSTIIFILPFRYYNWLEIAELSLIDKFFQLRPSEPTEERIVIVGITEKDIQKYQTYPFNDRFLADLIARIRIQKPIGIGLDITRDVPVPPGTEELNEIFRTTPNLIGTGVIGTLNDRYSHDIAFPPILETKGQVGDVSGTVDPDGKVRRAIIYPLQDGSEKSQISSLSLKMAYLYLEPKGIKPKGSSEGWLQLKDTVFYPYRLSEGNYQILIDWRNRPFQQVSVADVVEGKISNNLFFNKLVFLGGSSLSLKDVFFTPIGDRYGVEIQATVAAQIIDSVLEGRKLTRILSYDYLYLILWILLASIAFNRNKIFPIPLIALSLTIVATAIVYIGFNVGWLLPWAYPLGAILVAAISSIVHIYVRDLKNAQVLLESQVEARTLELSETNRKLEATLEELKETQQELLSKEKLAALGTLTGGLAHEVRNPLYRIGVDISAIDSAKRQIQEVFEEHEFFLEDFEGLIPTSSTNLGSIEKAVNKIVSYVDKANQIIDTILGYARREIVAAEPVDINIEIEEAIAAVRQVKSSLLEVEVVTNLDRDLGEILVIKNEIYRALVNSVENSWNALIDKQEIGNFEPRIEISSERSENNVIISIKDNGLGIKEEAKNKIFDPFFSTRKNKQGTGLGLYFVYEIIVNEHQGRVTVESEEGEGTELVMRIPIREKNHDPANN